MGRAHPDLLSPDACLEISGRLIANAHAAQRPTDREGHFAPTLCFAVHVGGSKRLCKVEQHFAIGQHDACDAAARTLRKGMQVRFDVPLHNFSVHAFGVMNVVPIATDTSTDAATEDSADLFAPPGAPPSARAVTHHIQETTA
jgi:hypothetical protein